MYYDKLFGFSFFFFNFFLRELFPSIGSRVKSSVCLYSCTDDHDFILDYHPQFDNVVVAGGFSGHGFKFAITIGRILTDMALHKTPEFDLSAFKIQRAGVSKKSKL